MHEQTNKILQAIRKACPELMELREGCWIKIWWMDDPTRGEPDETVIFSERSMKNNGDVDGHYRQIIEDNVTGTVEIIGHEPTLAHLLRAIDNKDKDDFLLTTDGRLLNYNFPETEDVACSFDLTLSLTDNLETNPELREFVYQLVVKAN